MRGLTFTMLAAVTLLAGNWQGPPAPDAIPNDNRTPAGLRSGDTLVLRLTVRPAVWRLHGPADPGFPLLAFAEEGKPAVIPGPLIRVRTGTTIAATIRNPLPDTLLVHGLGTRGDGTLDSLAIPPGASVETRFSAGKAGTYLYRGFTSKVIPGRQSSRLTQMTRIASQLAGAFVIDSAGAVPSDRVMVITSTFDQPNPGSGFGVLPLREYHAVNGKAWPYSERLTYAVGDSIRWRIVTASAAGHPMHLHGFYFRVDSRGSSFETDVDTVLAPAQREMAVTEPINVGQSRSIVWSPDRPGGWIFHCHLTHHMVRMPPVERPDSVAFPAHHHGDDPARHIESGMAGLITAITVTGPAPAEKAWRPAKRLTLFVQSATKPGDSLPRLGYVLERGAEPRRDSIESPGPVLVLTRGEPTSIEVVNRSGMPTAVHWHGIELESYYDGAVGWSGTPGRAGRTTPAIPDGGRFEVRITPQRAGTFMYHTHFDELRQQFGGLVGGLLVLEPGERRDPARDLLLVLSDGGHQRGTFARGVVFNGSPNPPPIQLKVGQTYRLRLADIAVNHAVYVRLRSDSATMRWRPAAKDGFPLSPALAQPRPAELAFMSGQTADFELVPSRPGTFVLDVAVPSNFEVRFACDVHLGKACFERVLGSQRFQVSP